MARLNTEVPQCEKDSTRRNIQKTCANTQAPKSGKTRIVLGKPQSNALLLPFSDGNTLQNQRQKKIQTFGQGLVTSTEKLPRASVQQLPSSADSSITQSTRKSSRMKTTRAQVKEERIMSSESEGTDSELDGFIVDDDEEISIYEDSVLKLDDTASEDDLQPSPPPTARRRRLMRGNKVQTLDDKKLESEIKIPVFARGSSVESPSRPSKLCDERKPWTKIKSLTPPVAFEPTKSDRSFVRVKKESADSSSDIEEPDARFVTPPQSPSKSRLQSPSKTGNRIPTAPHRESLDTFWSQEVVNDWNDQYSPRKERSPQKKGLFKVFFDSDSDGELASPERKPTLKSPAKLQLKKSSRDEKREEKARKEAWESSKHALAQSFVAYIDEKTAEGQVAALSASTGGIKITWSKTLNTTAGRAHWKRRLLPPDRSNTSQPERMYEHYATIELSTKVLTAVDTLLNTLAHEYCHLANFMISNVRDQPHGRSFKEWASRVMAVLSNHPEWGSGRVKITTKHSYAIEWKYLWLCVGKNENDWGCSTEYGRHSKSIDPQKVRCGKCGGTLRQVRPVPRSTPKTADAPAASAASTTAVKKGGKGTRGATPSANGFTQDPVPSEAKEQVSELDRLLADVRKQFEVVTVED